MATPLIRLKNQKPKFSSGQDALNFYSRELEILASKYRITSDKLVEMADEANNHNPDFVKALSLAGSIRAFKLTEI